MRLKQLSTLFALALLVFGCAKDQLDQALTPEALRQDPMPKAEMDAVVWNYLKEKNEPFRWESASSMMLWSATVTSDSIMSLGYKPAGETNVEQRMFEIDIQQPAWKAAKEKLINFVVEETNKAFPGLNATAADLVLNPNQKYLPTIDIKIFSLPIIEALREMPEVRYIEPMTYQLEEVGERSDSGCGVTAASSITSADYTTVAPSAKIPWNFNNANIPNAWNTTTGSGITVAMIDTGTSDNQDNVGSQFNSGYSSGRFIDRQGTHISGSWWWASNDGPHDQCGHGTQMAGLIAGPRSTDGNALGAAYNCNLLAFRATTDVVVNSSSEKNGVRDALIISGNRSDVKIISMSIGDVFYSSTVADGIYYAYGAGKLIFAAAGTSLSWTSWWGVIFPANMAETVAVTGIKDSPNMTKCNTCHSGPQVDFVCVMQRASDNNRTSLSLAPSGNQPSRVGGSSAATATTAGIAALVWSTNPSQTRTQVLDRLKNASSFFPSRNSNFGWGTINATNAVN
ncbi:MAG TPA: S8 family serine peptidase [Saprospiraceae bacterium]|nr:S8 family serine peptidase [Saprospiraceae bacterium]HMQ83107.1 S8 family serine peptidase [Saprospiraceae bacterium]